jgi:hypothetical protein
MGSLNLMVKATRPVLSIADVFYCPHAFLPHIPGMAKFKLIRSTAPNPDFKIGVKSAAQYQP